MPNDTPGANIAYWINQAVKQQTNHRTVDLQHVIKKADFLQRAGSFA